MNHPFRSGASTVRLISFSALIFLFGFLFFSQLNNSNALVNDDTQVVLEQIQEVSSDTELSLDKFPFLYAIFASAIAAHIIRFSRRVTTHDGHLSNLVLLHHIRPRSPPTHLTA